MNPVKITLLALGAWIILTIILCVCIVEDAFVMAVNSFYLLPVVCIVAFIASSIFYHSWVNNHKVIVAIILGLLIIWTLRIVFYIRSLFI